jgi:hypothetical protein
MYIATNRGNEREAVANVQMQKKLQQTQGHDCHNVSPLLRGRQQVELRRQQFPCIRNVVAPT